MDSRNPNGTFKPGHDGFNPKGSVGEFQKVTRKKIGGFSETEAYKEILTSFKNKMPEYQAFSSLHL